MWLENLNRIKKQSGKTTEEISKLSNVPIGTLNKLFAGQTQDPKLNTIKSVVNSLGYSLDDLTDDSPNNISLSDIEIINLEKYRSLDVKGKHTVDTILEMEYNRCNRPYLLPNAAHEIEGASEEDKAHDDALMDDEDF